MVLVVANAGSLRSAIEQGLVEAGHDVVVAEAHEELFEKAIGTSAIVYVPFSGTLAGRIRPQANTDRARAVLAAANAPGVEVVVFVAPPSGYGEEERVLKREGVPYVIVRVPLLLEEVAEVMAEDGARSLWVPREGVVAIAGMDALARTVAVAITTEEQGGDLPVPSSTVSAPELFAQASALGVAAKVHAVRPQIYRMVRPIARWVHRGEPAALGLWDEIVSTSAAATLPE